MSFIFSSEFLDLPSRQHRILLQKERSRSMRPYCDVAKPCDDKRTRIRTFAPKLKKIGHPGAHLLATINKQAVISD